MPKPKTLAMIKMHKNFQAVIEKGKPRKPYMVYSLMFFLKRLDEEVKELRKCIRQQDFEGAKFECGDVINLAEYTFERLCIVTDFRHQAYEEALKQEIEDNRAMQTIRKLDKAKQKEKKV